MDGIVQVQVSRLPTAVDTFHAQAKVVIYASLVGAIFLGRNFVAPPSVMTFDFGEVFPDVHHTFSFEGNPVVHGRLRHHSAHAVDEYRRRPEFRAPFPLTVQNNKILGFF